MNSTLKGALFGIISAISYGTNPLGALSLYKLGLNANSVLFYRFSIAALILAIMMLIQRKSFSIKLKELKKVCILGVLFGISSLSLFSSFHYMEAGVASTLLFVYPVMVAIIMTLFFKEKMSIITIVSISLALAGIILLYQGDGEGALSTIGVILVMISSLSYAVYIVFVNKSTLDMPAIKLTFWVLVFCVLTIASHSFLHQETHLLPVTTPAMLMWSLMLAIVPTIISLVTMVKAVKIIGSTPTAIMGALEPLTAIAIGIAVFGEKLTLRLSIGISMILVAVMLIICGKYLTSKMQLSRLHVVRKLSKKKHKHI